MEGIHCAAADLGAGTGRVVGATFDGTRITLREGVRFETPQFKDPATGWMCWDVDAIEARVREGLATADREAPLASVGVDSWGVDYVLVDGEGRRVGQAVCYRDERTLPEMPAVYARMPPEEIYRRTGIQFQAFNTLYQLAATARQQPGWLERARRFLMLPDWFHHRLCGVQANEYTNATTTQVYGLAADDWDAEVLAAAGVRRELFAKPLPPGTPLGEIDAPAGGVRKVKVIAPATHDTASAVAAIPLAGDDEMFISSGTWSLVGIESLTPYPSDAARRHNITNEGGVDRRFRVLENVVGLWLAQRIRAELPGFSHAALVEAADKAPPWRSVIDPEDPRFYDPPSMSAAFRDFCRQTSQPEPNDPGSLARCAFESLALAYRRVKDDLESLREKKITHVRIVGGGSQNRLLDQLCADACGIPVGAGPVETSALGNACMQLRALGAFGSLAELRETVRRSFAPDDFEPAAAVPDEVWRRFHGFRKVRREWQ